ncbi:MULTISPECIES: DUF6745 domain-containing protein [Streptomyces]|uniref:DUF6745 domain-containing protein n=1 Tax=Streptomyces TaxID=1883 RepID=UPI00293116E8|nr:hypothetical protein [Streptomyces sp. NEAU-HV9]
MESGRLITELTEAQESALREMGEDWAALEAATGPVDRAAAEDGVRTAYRALGLPPPRFIVWLGSPWAGRIGQAMLPGIIASVTGRRAARVRAMLRPRMSGQLGTGRGWFLQHEIYSRIAAQVSDELDGRVRALVCDPLPRLTGWRTLTHGHLRDQEYAQYVGVLSDEVDSDGYIRSARFDFEVVARAHAELVGQVAAQAGVSPVPGKTRPRLPMRWRRGTPWSASSVSQYAWAHAMEHIGVTGMDVVQGERQVARNAGYWWAFRDYAVLTPRPDVFRRDAGGRPHCADGPAAAWPDGWTVHAWHGTTVPASLIEGRWDTDRILQERNVEVRRCAIERMGWPEFIAAAGLRQVGRSEPDPGNTGQWLTLYDLPAAIYNVPVRVLLCTNASVERDGTRRQYGLTVPAETPDPTTAAAGLLGLTRDQYLTLTRAT